MTRLLNLFRSLNGGGKYFLESSKKSLMLLIGTVFIANLYFDLLSLNGIISKILHQRMFGVTLKSICCL